MNDKLNLVLILIFVLAGLLAAYNYTLSGFSDDMQRLQGIVCIGFAAVLNMLREDDN